jgi:hypothetical protein
LKAEIKASKKIQRSQWLHIAPSGNSFMVSGRRLKVLVMHLLRHGRENKGLKILLSI